MDVHSNETGYSRLRAKLSANFHYQKLLDQLLLKLNAMSLKSSEYVGTKKKTLTSLRFNKLKEESRFIPKPYKLLKDFGAPYFKDCLGFSPGKNKDEITMEKLFYLDQATLVQPVKWQHWEMKLLDETMRKVALGRLRRPFVAKKTALLDQLKTEQSANLSTALTEIKLDLLEKDIKKLSGEALFEMLSNPDMEFDWCRISVTEFEGLRAPLELRAMWRQCLVLVLDRKPWTKEETFGLREAAKKHNYEDWVAISAELGGRRSMFQNFMHYQSILNKHRERWTLAEDKKLCTAVKKLRQGKFIPWIKVAELLPGRRINQIHLRWSQHLDPQIKKGQFTERDDLILIAARGQKMSFRQISDLMPGRTESQLRIRYTRLECFKPAVPWLPEDDQRLMALVVQFAKSRDKWAIINQYFPERDRQQLKGRHKRLLNEAAGIKNTLPRKGKKSMWSQNKRRTTPIFSAKNVLKFAYNSERRGKVGRKSRKKSPLDLEFDQIFRSHYAQPKGRRKKYHPNAAFPTSVVEGQRLSEMLGVHFDWNAEKRFESAAANDADFYSVLNVYRQLKMLHSEEYWDSERMVVSQRMPPNVCTLVGIRTLLLEQRNVLAMSLNERQETPTYLKGVIAKADQAFNPPKLDEPASISGVRQPKAPEAALMSPELSMSLFRQRFLSLFWWPSIMSKLAPSLDYKKDLFEGERMACASSDEEIVGNLFLNFDTDKEDDHEDMLKPTENRKDQMKEQWLQYREQRLNNVPLDEQDNEGPSLLQKRRRLPKKRGRKKLRNENWLQSHIRNSLDI